MWEWPFGVEADSGMWEIVLLSLNGCIGTLFKTPNVDDVNLSHGNTNYYMTKHVSPVQKDLQ